MIFIGILFSPLFETMAWADYIMIAGAGILLGAGIYYREKRKSKGQNEIVAALQTMTNQQKDLLVDVIHSNHLNHTSLQELKVSFEEMNSSTKKGMKEMNDKVEENHREMFGLFEQKSNDVLEEMKSSKAVFEKQLNDINGTITMFQQQQSQHLVTIIEQVDKAGVNLLDGLSRESMRIIDSIKDVERTLNRLEKQVTDEIESVRETQDDFYENYQENMISSQNTIMQASEDIRKYRENTEKDILERTETLTGLVIHLSDIIDQLADSKHDERVKALEVQTQLATQFERLKARG